jgi:hypothetical protein
MLPMHIERGTGLAWLLAVACGGSGESPSVGTEESSGTTDTATDSSGPLADGSSGTTQDASTTADEPASSGSASSGSSTEGDSSTVTDGKVESGTESSSEDGSSSDTGTAAWTSPCPPYSGLGNIGSTWDTSSTPAFEAKNLISIDTHREVVDVQEGPTTSLTVLVTTDSTGDGFDVTTLTTLIYACDESGAWLQTADSETTGVSGGQPFSTWNESTYAPALFLMPWDVAVGSEWEAASTITTVFEGGSNVVESATSYAVAGSEEVRTPIGTFDALVIAWEGDGASGSWLADAEAGTVGWPDGSYELVDVSVVAF